MKISDVDPIEESGYVTMPTREELARLVEMPILNACQILWDKNIITGMSSANRKDVGRVAYINLPKRYLSDDNVIVLESLPNIEEYHSDMTEDAFRITYPVSEESTVEEVSSFFEKTAGMLACQDILYGVYPITSARDCYRTYTGVDADSDETDEEIAESLGMVVQGGLIFDSEIVFQRHLNYVKSSVNTPKAK